MEFTKLEDEQRKFFDENGYLASIGIKNEIIFEQAQELYINRNNKNIN